MSERGDAWLLRRERGEDVSHVPANMRARYDQLGELIQALPEDAPSAGWKQRVLAELDKPRPCVTRAPWWQKPQGALWLAVAALAIAAPSVAIMAWYRPTHERVVVAVASPPSVPARQIDNSMFGLTIRRGSKPARGEVWVMGLAGGTTEPSPGDRERAAQLPARRLFARVGDTLVLHVKADAALELRVYSDAGRPLARCAALLDCSIEMVDNVPWLTLEVPLQASGRVSAYLFAGTPPTTRDLNTDLAAAHKMSLATREISVVRID